MRPILPVLLLVAACSSAAQVQPVAARIAGSELTVTLSDERSCRFALPAGGLAESLPVTGCRGLESVAVHRHDPAETTVILRMFDGEGPLPNDGAPRSVWVGTDRGTWRFQG